MNENGNIRINDTNRDNPFETIDWDKFKSVFRRNAFWIIALIGVCNLGAYLYIRYTKPMYESYSDLKLEVKSEAISLGLSRFQDNYNINNMSGEIELINSRLFFNKVIDAVDINLQYFTHGKILDDEKYKHSPFKVDYLLEDPSFYHKPFNVLFLGNNQFKLEYADGENTISNNYEFGQVISKDGFRFQIYKTPYFSEELMEERFYFVINTHESLIDYFEENITVEPLNLNANSIRISFKDHNKYKAFDLVNAIDTLYLNYTSQEKNQANESRIDYLNEQLSETAKILEEFEDYFENFTIDNKTVDLDQDVKTTLGFINSLDSQRFELRARITHVEKLEEQIITEELENINIKRNYIPADLVRKLEVLDRLHFEYEQLGLAYKENTYAFERKTQELNLVRGNMVTGLNQYKLNLYESLTEVNNRKGDLETRLRALPSKGTEYNKAKRFYALYEEMYMSLMQSKNEFEIALAGTVPDFKILSSASLTDTPIAPNKLIVYGTGIISSLILSFLFLGISYLVNDQITSVNEVENLTSAPIVGTLPSYRNNDIDKGTVVQSRPRSAVSEAFRSIRTNIEFILPGQKKKVISVSSAVSGEGKTFISLNLGAVIALSGQKVLILDLDLRKPRIHKYFNNENTSKGISTMLINKHEVHECIVKTDLQDLHYIPSGPLPPNPSELLLSERFHEIIVKLQDEYDTIILDTPPIGLVTDAVMVMRSTDLKLFVVRADYSRRPYLKIVNRLININKFKNIGVVVNALKGQGGYGYGYGYGYGSNYYDEMDNGSLFSSVMRKLKV